PRTFNFTTADRGNLSRLPNVLVSASTSAPSYPPSNAVDGNLLTDWFTNSGDATPHSLEVTFLEDVLVLGVNLFNSRSFTSGFDSLPGKVTLLTGDRKVLWESPVFALDEGSFQDKHLAVPGAGLAGVRRVVFDGLTHEGNQAGLAEMQVMGRFA